MEWHREAALIAAASANSSEFCSSKVGGALLSSLRLRAVCSHAAELDAAAQRRTFPFRAFVLQNALLGPGVHRPHRKDPRFRQPGLNLTARCTRAGSAPLFAPLPRTYSLMVSRLVRRPEYAPPPADGEACLNATLVVIEPPDLWNVWWVLEDAVKIYALLAALLPTIKTGAPVHLAHAVDDWRKQVAGRPLFRALFASPGVEVLNFADASDVAKLPRCYRHIVLLPHENPWILQNGRHKTSSCASPIVQGFAARMRARFAKVVAPPPPLSAGGGRGETSTWCWVRRAETTKLGGWWTQRLVKDQTGLIQKVGQGTAATVRELHFETGRYSLAEQMRTVAEGCTLLMGVHGAGLNLAIAMDPPVVLEVVGSRGIPNKNSPNLVTAAGGCYRRASILKEASHTIAPAELRSHAERAAAECGRDGGR